MTSPFALSGGPDIWGNLMNLGAGMSVAANARTPQGFLANGPGFAGALGAGTMLAEQQAQRQAQLQSQMGLQQAQAGQTRAQTNLLNYQLPLLQQSMHLMGALANGGLPGMNATPFGGGAQPAAQPVADPNALPAGQRFDLLTQAVKGTPIPADLAASLVSHESGWDPAKVNPQTGAFGLGQVLPSTAQNPGFGMSPLPKDATPQQQLAWSVRYLWARGKAAGIQDSDWGDPQKVATALAAYHGPQADANGVNGQQYAAAVGNKQPFRAAQTGNGPMPSQGGDYTQNPAYQQAQRLYQLSAAMGMSPYTRGISEVYKSQADQLMQLAMAGPKAMAGVPAAQAEKGWEVGPNGNLTPIPGGPADPNYIASAANAKPITMREGGEAGILNPETGQREWVKNPMLEKLKLPDGSEVFAHITPAPPGSPAGTPGEATIVTNGTGKPSVAEIAPQQEEFLKGRGKQLSEQFNQIDEDAAAAVRNNYLFDNLRNDSQSWQMGKFASFEGDAKAWLSAAAHAAGINPTGLDKQLGDFQAFNKSSGMLLREAVHKISSRAAVQEYKMIGDTLPTPTTSEQGFGQIADQWQALNDYEIAKQKYAQQYQGHPQDFNVNFNGNVSPTAFLLNRMSQTQDGQRDMGAMIGRMQQTPEGRQMLARLKRGYYYAQQHGLFDGLPPIGAQSAPPAAGGQ